jgi:HEAT repeat protein
VLRDVIEVVGRRRLERAIPTLAAMRHHADERVRTAALRALENIGTSEAIAALR